MEGKHPTPFLSSRLDQVIVFFFCIFTWSSLVMEMFIVFSVDVSQRDDLHSRLWHWYNQFDPVFRDPPFFLYVMCTIDGFIFGLYYPCAIYGIVKRKWWIRPTGIAYASAIVYSTIVYFAFEFVVEIERINVTAVILANIPYTIVPIIFGFRVLHSDFDSKDERSSKVAVIKKKN